MREEDSLIADLIANAPRGDVRPFVQRLRHSCGHEANVTMFGAYRLDDRFHHASLHPCWACMTYQSGIHCGHYTHKACSFSTISAITFVIERDDIQGA
jgi:hypothetical protein